MICFISKWLISGAFDSRRSIPGFLKAHIDRCPSCRDFIRLSQTLEKRAAEDARIIIQTTPQSFQKKIQTQPLRSGEPKKQFWKPRWMIPVVTVSTAAIVFLIFLLAPSSKSLSPPQGVDSFFMFGRDSLPGGTLQKLATQIESPYETEWNSLKKNVKSATDHLRAKLDLKINPDKK